MDDSSSDMTATGDTATLEYSSPEECAECHPTHYDEWQRSMHAYAAKSPSFDVISAKTYRDTSGEIGTFCTGCHTPIGEAQGEPGWTTAATRSDISRSGISCDYCHTVKDNGLVIGNQEFVDGPSHVKSGPYESDYTGAHATTKSDFIQSPEFCGGCHDVFKFPGLNIEQAYTEYVDSYAAEDGQSCQDCHMSPTPGVADEKPMGPSAIVDGVEYPDRELSSHLFVGPDYALIDDFPYEDDLEASAIAQEEHLLQVETLLQNSAELADVTVTASDSSLNIDVTVRSLTAGHWIPTGFTAERQMWLAVEVADSNGFVVWQTGDLDSNGDLRNEHSIEVMSGESFEDSSLVNYQALNTVNWRYYEEDGTFSMDHLGGTYNTVLPTDAISILRMGLQPLEERVESYEVFVASGSLTEATVTVSLYFRNLPPYIFRELGVAELAERLHVFTIDSTSVEVEL